MAGFRWVGGIVAAERSEDEAESEDKSKKLPYLLNRLAELLGENF